MHSLKTCWVWLLIEEMLFKQCSVLIIVSNLKTTFSYATHRLWNTGIISQWREWGILVKRSTKRDYFGLCVVCVPVCVCLCACVSVYLWFTRPNITCTSLNLLLGWPYHFLLWFILLLTLLQSHHLCCLLSQHVCPITVTLRQSGSKFSTLFQLQRGQTPPDISLRGKDTDRATHRHLTAVKHLPTPRNRKLLMMSICQKASSCRWLLTVYFSCWLANSFSFPVFPAQPNHCVYLHTVCHVVQVICRC